ncbi:MAG: ROK family protein [Prevotellaceae bacterium]|nr:ROK family protein [Prevotellaceae bacterium]
MEQDFVVGVDIGGQTTKIGVVDRKGNVISNAHVIRTDSHTDEMLFFDDLTKAIKSVVQETNTTGKIKGVGIGAPNGNYYDGTIVQAVNLTWGGRKTIKVAEILTNKLGLPVTLTNDANAAAVGEMTYGAAIGMKNFIMITLGTGVGSGIVINGQMVYGHDGFAGELGHTTAVRYNGRQCNCGRVGCIEAYASAIGLARTAREYLESNIDKELFNQSSPLREVVGPITSKDVYLAASQGDGLSKKVFDFTGTKLGESLADFVAFSAPQAIILFGGLTKAGDLITKPTEQAMNENMLSLWRGKVAIIVSKLPESDAAILGASALAW